MSSTLDPQTLVPKLREAVRTHAQSEELSLKHVCQTIDPTNGADLAEEIEDRITRDETMARKVVKTPEIARLTLAHRWTLAHLAVVHHPRAGRKALENPEVYKLCNGADQRVIHYIARSDPDVVQEMLRQCSDELELTDEEGYSVLDEAIISNAEAVVDGFWEVNLSPGKQREMLYALASLVTKEPLQQALQNPTWTQHLSDELRTTLLTHPDPKVRRIAMTALKNRDQTPPTQPKRAGGR